MMDSWTVVVARMRAVQARPASAPDFSQSLSIKAQPSRVQPTATKGGTIGAQF